MLNPTFVLRFPPLRQAANRWTTFHLRWSFVCRPAGKRQGSCIQNKCRPMRRLTRFLNPPKLGIEQNIVQHAFDEIGYPALRAPLRRRASSHRIALRPGLRQAPHWWQPYGHRHKLKRQDIILTKGNRPLPIRKS